MDGAYVIAAQPRHAADSFRATAAADGTALPGDFAITPLAEVAEACAAADAAFDAYRELPPQQRASFLEAIANELTAISPDLVERAMLETGLPPARLTGEVGRTCNQLRLFAQILREGCWLDLVIEHAQPERQPLPRPDLRRRMIPLGPVAVFGASNFPLAFSVAGGDTASALAAGCPVVVKAHPAHPGTSLLAAQAIARAVASQGLPGGVFSLIQGPDNALGAALVADPHIAAVGFTGSRAGGLALMRIAAGRAVPIPVFAEMSSINPVILLPEVLGAQAEELAKAYVGSLTLGAGQFCTNPGVVLAVEGPAVARFIAAAQADVSQAAAQTMLHLGIAQAYHDGTQRLASAEGVTREAQGASAGAGHGQAQLFSVSAARFLADEALGAEVFGPSSLIVRCANAAELRACIASLEGQLTATLHMADGDMAAAQALLPLLERKVGRILVNGWPTGVEVSRAMVHGGPYPATSDSRTTSVGAKAIDRFLRPVCYQAMAEALLPAALRDGNPLGLPQNRFD